MLRIGRISTVLRQFLKVTVRIAICVATILIASTPISESTHAQDNRPSDPRFGVIEAHDAPDQASTLGITWGRARFHWGSIQPDGPDEWIDAELSTEQLQREKEDGREIVGLLIGVPAWAKDADGLPQGLYLPSDDPANLWAIFVREAVTRYQSEINHWIIWNEPDVWDSGHPGYTWPGSEADYVQLLKTAYLVAKDANPDAVIHLAAVSHWWDALYDRQLYFERLLDVLVAEPDAADHNYYYDVATLHLYFNPASIYEVIKQYHLIQQEHGLDKPIWLVETNAAPSSDPARTVSDPTFHVSLLEQASFAPQVLTLAAAAGAERIGLYKLIDTKGDINANPEPFGLIRADGSERPIFQTTQTAIEQLSGAESIIWTERHLTSQVVITAPDKLTRMLWSRIPAAQEVHIPAAADSAILVNMWGNETIISPRDGTYTIIVYGGECQQTTGDYCMIGGPPVYIVEEVDSGVDTASLFLDSVPVTEGALPHNDSNSGSNLLVWLVAISAVILIAIAGPILMKRSLFRR
jgi:hypothetical protein